VENNDDQNSTITIPFHLHTERNSLAKFQRNSILLISSVHSFRLFISHIVTTVIF
jgi:hypothetical protein